MSSTENTGDQTPQSPSSPEETLQASQDPALTADATGGAAAPEEGATPEVAEPAAGESAVGTPDAGTPVAADPADAAPAAPTAGTPVADEAAGLAAAAAAGDLGTPPADAPAGDEQSTGALAAAAEADVLAAAPAAPSPEVTPAPAAAAAPEALTDSVPQSVGELPAVPVSGPPVPRPPVPHAPVPHAPVPHAPVPHAPAEGDATAVEAPPAAPASDPTQWGRVDEEGTVFVRTADGERAVGSWQAGEPAEGLAHYGRRFDDLATEVSLLEARLAAHTGNPGEIKSKAQALADTVPAATAVGDLDGLAARARAMVSTADAALAESRAEKAAARAAQVQRKEALAAEAEQIAADSTQWKAAGDRLKAIVEEWKTIRGIDRKTDDALWQRFAAARDAFGRRRGAHFATLDAQRAESRAAKTELITEAERLSTSTEWGPTSAAMRSLMDRWKAVPRTGRDTDDDLWKRFRGAQDVFFAARTANDQARSSEEVANQQQKEELLAEAEKLDPSKDLRGAQHALRKIQERYDAIGHVPRGVMRDLEDRMRAVEQKVRGAVDSSRPRTEPENPLLTSMRAAVTKAEEQLAKAEAAGNAKRVSEAQDALTTRREWLAEAEKAAGRR
ncbi:DUF349 domain-containing protein [Modestobacter lapidis]